MIKKKPKIYSADRVKEKMGKYIVTPHRFLPSSQYSVIIEQDEDGYFVASVPALPGCHTQAKTLPELRKRVKEAIRLCLEVAETDAQYKNQILELAHQPNFIAMEMVTI